MSEHYERHAEAVSNAFMELLDEHVREGIGEAQRQQLAMLIEAAISTAVFEQLEHAADKADALVQQIRQHAERYDKGADYPV
jgi:hypothetical protein